VASAKIWVFDVDHGFMAFIRAPSGATLAIDCGLAADFSPTVYIRDKELEEWERCAECPISKLVLTHPHDDHIEDIERLAAYLKPHRITRQEYDWEEVEAQSQGECQNLHQWEQLLEHYSFPADDPDWGPMKLTHWCLTVDEAKQLNQSKFVNNSSIISIVEIGSFKMTFPGDIEKDGWLAKLQDPDFCKALSGTDVFVTSHHGHSSGYVPEIYEAMGKPWFNLSSIHHGDLSIESAYSTPDSARGVECNGEPRYSFTTRKDHSCFVKVDEFGRWSFGFYDLGANVPRPTSYGRGW